MNTTDSRVESAQALLTGARLLEGHGQGLVRVPGVGRLLGVSIWQRRQRTPSAAIGEPARPLDGPGRHNYGGLARA